MKSSYSRIEANVILIGLLFFASLLIGMLTPAFQSPDEINHFVRALGIADGHLKAKNATVYIDSAMHQMFAIYHQLPFHYEIKNTQALQNQIQNLAWTGQKEPLGIANTAVYFPLVYIPQVIGILIAKLLELTPYQTYLAAKLSNISITFLLLLWANRIKTISPLVIMLFGMPMSLFLAASASPDGVSFALIALVAALFLKIYHQEKSVSLPKEAYLLAVVIFAIITARINMFPILLLFPLLGRKRNITYKQSVILFFCTFLPATVWVLYAFKSVSAQFVNSGMTASQKLIHYLQTPTHLIEIFSRTFSSPNINLDYWMQFIGVLGWLDTPLPLFYYPFFSALLFIGFVFYFSKDKTMLMFSLFLFIITNLLTHFILLVSWTNLTDTTIQGVQGRYFIPIFILIAYLCFDDSAHIFAGSKVMTTLKQWLPFILIVFSSVATLTAIANRYLLS